MEERTYKELIEEHGITMSCEPADSNPAPFMGDTEMDHWSVLITCGVRSMQTNFSTGIGHRKLPKKGYVHYRGERLTRNTLAWEAREKCKVAVKPDLETVLDCLVSDSSSVQDQLFEDWASDFGYDTDSRKAEKTYNICDRQAKLFMRLLGKPLYETMLWNTERL